MGRYKTTEDMAPFLHADHDHSGTKQGTKTTESFQAGVKPTVLFSSSILADKKDVKCESLAAPGMQHMLADLKSVCLLLPVIQVFIHDHEL